MNLLIVGCTKEGARLANRLSRKGHAVSLVDRREESFSLLSPEYSGYVTAGIPIDQDVLIRAGIENCDTVLAVTDDDNTNILVCELSKSLFGVNKAVARINDSEKETIFRQMGIETFSSTRATADALKSILLDEENFRLSTSQGALDFQWMAPPKKWIGIAAGQLQGTSRRRLIGVETKDGFLLTGAESHYRIQPEDRLLIVVVEEGEDA